MAKRQRARGMDCSVSCGERLRAPCVVCEKRMSLESTAWVGIFLFIYDEAAPRGVLHPRPSLPKSMLTTRQLRGESYTHTRRCSAAANGGRAPLCAPAPRVPAPEEGARHPGGLHRVHEGTGGAGAGCSTKAHRECSSIPCISTVRA